MNKVILTLEFASMEEAGAYLLGATDAPVAKVASAQPSAAPAPAANVVEMPAAAPAAAPTPAPVATEEPIDLHALRADLMSKLRELAGGMDDPKPVGDFIHTFGVQKFSDLADDQLVTFEANLKEQFGV